MNNKNCNNCIYHKSIYVLAREAGLSYYIVKKRLDKGLTLEEALSLPRERKYGNG